MQDDQQQKKGQFYELGPFRFDVAAARKIIQEESRPDRLEEIDVADCARTLGLHRSQEEIRQDGIVRILVGEVDEEYARTQADLSVPLIIADLSKEGDEEPSYLMIDGAHRLRRAFVEGVEMLPVYRLDRAETLRIRSLKSYR